jgi:hypothetical protein
METGNDLPARSVGSIVALWVGALLPLYGGFLASCAKYSWLHLFRSVALCSSQPWLNVKCFGFRRLRLRERRLLSAEISAFAENSASSRLQKLDILKA